MSRRAGLLFVLLIGGNMLLGLLIPAGLLWPYLAWCCATGFAWGWSARSEKIRHRKGRT